MSKFIINSKVYDTEKMELVAEVEKVYPVQSLILKSMYGKDIGMRRGCDLYRSAKGNYLLVSKADDERTSVKQYQRMKQSSY
ncbi:MAG: hypothetical protein ACI38A_01830 [Candidatus Ornithomonoglobus sp.]